MPAITAAQLDGLSREELVALVVTLSAQVTALSEQVAILTEKVAANAATSRTSSKPPSSDGYGKPAPTSRRTRTGRKPGGQPGSAGTTLRQVADPDVVVEHRPAVCGGCSASLAGRVPARVARRQVVDLPEPRLEWTEHQVATVVCSCGQVTTAGVADGVPSGVVVPVAYGANVKAIAVYLMNAHFLPAARCAQVMSDLLGASVSVGSVMAWQAHAAGCLAEPEGFLETVTEQLREADVLHADETGLRTAGSLAWVHVAATLAVVLFTVHVGAGRRGKVAIEAAGVIERLRPGAVLVSDAWAPYLTYAMLHALCGAHVVRELRAACEAAPACTTDAGSQSWAHKLLNLLETVNVDAHQARAAGASGIQTDLLAERVTSFEKILALGHQQNPAPPGGWPGAARRPKAVNLLLRIDARREDYLRFAHDLSVPFTNNLAERDLRGVRLREKVSGSLRTVAGAKAFVALRSYLLTAARQQQQALGVLRDLFNGHPWIPQATTA